MEQELIDYLFEKGYLDIDKIIKDYVSGDTNYTTYTLLKKVIEDYNTTK